jgi:predicted O-methyltransferase YrrM
MNRILIELSKRLPVVGPKVARYQRLVAKDEAALLGLQIAPAASIADTPERVLEHVMPAEEPAAPTLWIEPGHFYSPITTTADFTRFDARDGVPGIELHASAQRALLHLLAGHCDSQPFTDSPVESNRYYFDNDQFSYSDALGLFGMLLHLKPRRIIEVGSGYSSALMLDVNNQFLDNSMDLTFIEPYPDRLRRLLRAADSPTIVEQLVQDVPIATFDRLEAGDILFIDSSHVAKSGSDVNWLYHEVLPRIRPGVIVHVHDIMYPFEYPTDWIQQGRSWNEAYMLRCLLSGSPRYKLLFWANYLHQFYGDEMRVLMPLSVRNKGGSIWFSIEPEPT